MISAVVLRRPSPAHHQALRARMALAHGAGLVEFGFVLGAGDYLGAIVHHPQRADFDPATALQGLAVDATPCQRRLDIVPAPTPTGHGPEPRTRTAAIIRFRSGHGDAIDRWAAGIQALPAEAEASLRIDGILRESWFSFVHGAHTFLFGYMERPATPLLPHAGPRPRLRVDAIHQDFKDAWDRSLRIPCMHEWTAP